MITSNFDQWFSENYDHFYNSPVMQELFGIGLDMKKREQMLEDDKDLNTKKKRTVEQLLMSRYGDESAFRDRIFLHIDEELLLMKRNKRYA